ncbi:flagellar protein FlaG [Caminibacter pacificus]|uniref:Flagellar biosynthesis protein FlaG n=1 Tax=Caminibacter pacificus TaxID=1424653 RepID=A0AAJ4RCL1_9BACT|nr:flagellar protein FlaG [Caminibacter pacificus]NPA88218.1 flagellar biosynthesis protein FlaG [Campylobacterota bacterium]QCI27820.1 flagellar biosynthesis protein FlaG [Caminibacter pacificus]ROR40005.1 flagellar protein FlaG [Caminibacter pacificus]
MDIFSSINVVAKKMDYTTVKPTNDVNHVQKMSEHLQDKKSKEEIQKELQQVVEELNKAMNPLNTDLKFRFNDKVDELVVEVVDKKSDQVIREFPPKEALKLMEKMRELVGMLFDKKG